jgi:cobalt-zinc-cadmium efflux system membrane fusion protein
MKTLLSALSLALLLASTARAQPPDTAAAAPVILDATAVENLRIKTALVEETDFDETIFALGRIEARPGNVAAVSSRIAGRVVVLNALPGDRLEAGAEVAKVESRQPGNPPPVLSLNAPLGGVVTRLDVRLGDPVEPDKALLEITDLGEVYAIARVPEHVAGRIKSGATAYIAVSASSEEKREGKLLRFGTAADPVSGTIDAIFPLTNLENQLRPGMRAEFSIVVSRRANVLSIPRSALQGEPSKRFVYVKDFNLPNAFIKAPVVVGQSNERFVEIISGVLPADEVVTQGAYSLAFVGGGSVSLKDALDAAHGHEHAADGSELTAESKKNSGAAVEGKDHGHAHEGNPFWMIVSGVLFLALLVVSFWRKRGATQAS